MYVILRIKKRKREVTTFFYNVKVNRDYLLQEDSISLVNQQAT